VLRFPLPQAPRHPRFNALDRALEGRGAGAAGADGGPFRLRASNALWGQKDYAFQAPYLDLLAEHYGAGMHVVDFQQATEPARLTINGWVARQTEDRIQDLLPAGSVSPATRLVLTNTVYFNAAWATPFHKDRTSPADFKRLDGTTTKVQMMSRRGHIAYAQEGGVQAVELPYQGDEVSLLVLLPDEGRFDAFEAALDPALLGTLVGKLQKTDLILSLPRFESDSTLGMKESLAALGIKDLFGAGADLSGMNGRKDLYVSNVLHKAFIKVTEAGTEAGGATGVIIDVVSAPPVVTADRPFLYVLRDRPTGSLLFVGRVTTPKSS
jgi:serpin B